MEGGPGWVVGLGAVGGVVGVWRMGMGCGVWMSWVEVGYRLELGAGDCRWVLEVEMMEGTRC